MVIEPANVTGGAGRYITAAFKTAVLGSLAAGS
jgi:hypothetical protein